MKIVEYTTIQQSIHLAKDLEAMIQSQKAAFIDFSSGLYDVPLPMQFNFPKYHSDSHIKGAYRKGSKYFVLKIANSSPLGAHGIILVFASDTGEPKFILNDQGYLTTLRTAIAGIIVSELLPWHIQNIGIIGSGYLAKMLYQLTQLKYPEKNLLLCARNPDKLLPITHSICTSVEELQSRCDLIFTATSSESPLIHQINLDSHQAIVALGSDNEHKRELSLDIYSKSDVVIIDSKRQAMQFGDVEKAISSKAISPGSLIEIGHILQSGISEHAKTIVADFSGIAAQDVAILEFILERLV